MEDYPANTEDGRRWVRRGDIPGLMDETFLRALKLYTMWKRFGLPHGRGWLAESEGVLQMISIVDEETNLYERHRLEESRKNRGNSRRT